MLHDLGHRDDHIHDLKRDEGHVLWISGAMLSQIDHGRQVAVAIPLLTLAAQALSSDYGVEECSDIRGVECCPSDVEVLGVHSLGG